MTDEHGRCRLDKPDDFVRLEIEAALSRGILVIPVLVDGARMPRADELPPSLAALPRRQALELSPARFDFDTSRLLRVLDRSLAEVRAAQQDAAPTDIALAPASAAQPEAPPRREPAGPSSTPGSPPAGPATPAERSPAESGRPPPKRHRRRTAWVLAGASAGVVLIVVIVAVVANSGTTPPAPGAGATTPAGAGATTSPPGNGVIFQDNFSSKASQWLPYQEAWTGRYANGTYLISAPPSAKGDARVSSPRGASSVYPYAPSNIRIEVQARRLPASDQNMNYGIACRINGNDAYVLTVSDGYASIERYGTYKLLKEAKILVNANSTNRLRAICAGVKGKQAVRLELWVNGKKAAEAADADHPLPAGTVGLVVGVDQTKRVSMAEFDNFTVSRV